MKCDHIRIRDFDSVEETILHLSGDIAHFLITDRESRERDPTVAKTFFTPEALRKYLEKLTTTSVELTPPQGQPDAPLEDDDILMPDDEANDESGEPGDDSPEDGSSRLEAATYQPPLQHYTNDELLQAVVIWARVQVAAATNDCPSKRFMLRAYTPKGGRTLCTISFTAENTAWRPPARAPHEPQRLSPPASVSLEASSHIPSAPVEPAGSGWIAQPAAPPFLPPPGMLIYPAHYQDGTLFGTSGAFRQLNQSYQDMNRLMLGGVEQLQGMMSQVLQDMGSDLRESRGQVSQLVNDILGHRVREVEVMGQIQENAQQVDQRGLLAREAIGQIGEAARAFFQSRGIAPELAEVLGDVSSHPELMEALRDPGVRELLQDTNNVHALAVSLRQIGQQQRAARAMMGTGPAAQALPPSQAWPPSGQATGWPGGGSPTAPGVPGGQYAGGMPGQGDASHYPASGFPQSSAPQPYNNRTGGTPSPQMPGPNPPAFPGGYPSAGMPQASMGPSPQHSHAPQASSPLSGGGWPSAPSAPSPAYPGQPGWEPRSMPQPAGQLPGQPVQTHPTSPQAGQMPPGAPLQPSSQAPYPPQYHGHPGSPGAPAAPVGGPSRIG